MWFSGRKKREAEQRQREIEMTWYAPMAMAVKNFKFEAPMQSVIKINEPKETSTMNHGAPTTWSTVDFKVRKYRYQLPPFPLEIRQGSGSDLFAKRTNNTITVQVKPEVLRKWRDDLGYIVKHPSTVKKAIALYRQEREWLRDSAVFM